MNLKTMTTSRRILRGSRRMAVISALAVLAGTVLLTDAAVLANPGSHHRTRTIVGKVTTPTAGHGVPATPASAARPTVGVKVGHGGAGGSTGTGAGSP
ncbi:MAG: hypothetical protein ACYDAD_09605, partial [Acidimicrobiales bacterium]